MLTTRYKPFFNALLEPIARVVARLGVDPSFLVPLAASGRDRLCCA